MKNICTKYGGRVIRDRVQYWEIIADNLSKAGTNRESVRPRKPAITKLANDLHELEKTEFSQALGRKILGK